MKGLPVTEILIWAWVNASKLRWNFSANSSSRGRGHRRRGELVENHHLGGTCHGWPGSCPGCGYYQLPNGVTGGGATSPPSAWPALDTRRASLGVTGPDRAESEPRQVLGSADQEGQSDQAPSDIRRTTGAGRGVGGGRGEGNSTGVGGEEGANTSARPRFNASSPPARMRAIPAWSASPCPRCAVSSSRMICNTGDTRSNHLRSFTYRSWRRGQRESGRISDARQRACSCPWAFPTSPGGRMADDSDHGRPPGCNEDPESTQDV
jgi:hypothetical protein